MNLTITPKKLSGPVRVPASKSAAHRLLLCAAFAKGESRISNFTLSADMEATLHGMKALGAEYALEEDTLRISGSGGVWMPRREHSPIALECGESGTTLRCLIPPALAAAGGEEVCFIGHGRLMERPLGPYFQIFQEKGITYRQTGNRLYIKGQLLPGEYALSGQVSSQFVTGLLLGLSLLPGPSEIRITDSLQSRGYVDMTLDAMEKFGVQVENEGYRLFLLSGSAEYRPWFGAVEGDWSQAAFFLAANFLGSGIALVGLDGNSFQRDRTVIELLRRFASPGDLTVDAGDIPDLIPALAMAAAGRPEGKVTFANAARLRLKESDRIVTIAALVRALGGKAAEGPAFLEITGQGALPGGGTVDCVNDHRIAMAAAIGATICKGPVTLLGAECVAKSYPAFWEDYRRLGGIANLV